MFDTLSAGLTFRGKKTTPAVTAKTHAEGLPASRPSKAAETDTLSKSPRGIFKSAWALPTLGAVCLPHVPEVLSTLALAHTTNQLFEGELPTHALAVLVGLQLTQLATQPLARWAIARWKDDATRAYANDLTQAMYNKPRLWLQQKPKEAEAAMSFANDTPWAVQESVANTAAGVELLSGMALHGAMVAVMLDARIAINFALALGAAGAAGKLVVRLQSAFEPKPRNASGETADAFFKTKRADFWDNVVLGNRDNAMRWAGDYDLAFSDWSSRLVRQDVIKNVLSLGASVLCGSLATYNLVHAARQSSQQGDMSAFAGMVLPMTWRACESLNSASAMMHWLPGYQSHEKIFARVLRDTNPTPSLDLRAHMGQHAKAITLTRSNAAPVRVDRDHLDAVLAMAHEPGVITVEGPNGAGKSMLMTWLKEQLGEHAFMWPSKNQLQFGLTPNSSGGLAMGALRRMPEMLASYPEVRVLFLDEIDANLDPANCEVAQKLVNQLAQQYCIFDITHRNQKDT